MTVTFKNISATTAPFVLPPGLYGLDASATWGGGSVALQQLSADGSTYLAVGTALSANGSQSPLYLAGTYQLAVTTATAVYAAITSILQY